MSSLLDRADSLNRNYVPMTDGIDSLLLEAVEYYDRHGTPNHGCVPTISSVVRTVTWTMPLKPSTAIRTLPMLQIPWIATATMVWKNRLRSAVQAPTNN